MEVFCKVDVLKNFVNVTGTHLRRSLFLLQAEALQLTQKKSLALVLLMILQNL